MFRFSQGWQRQRVAGGAPSGPTAKQCPGTRAQVSGTGSRDRKQLLVGKECQGQRATSAEKVR